MRSTRSAGQTAVCKSIKTAAAVPVQYDVLIAAIGEIQRALACAGGKVQKPTRQFLASLEKAERYLEQHIRLSEGPEGLVTQIHEEHPYLARSAERLRGEHAAMVRQFKQIRYTLTRFSSVGPKNLDRLVQKLERVLEALRSHQDGATELLFRAYFTELGIKG